MLNQTLTSLAILKVNFDHSSRDYLENFVGMAAECIRRNKSQTITAEDTQRIFRTEFGLTIPQHAVKSILRRVARHNYIIQKDRAYYKNDKKLAELRFQETRHEVIKMHENLIESLIDFATLKKGQPWTVAIAEQSLVSFLNENQVFLMNLVAEAETIEEQAAEQKLQTKGANYIVASFIQQLIAEESANLSYLEAIIKGHMLANVIFVNDPGRILQKFQDTTVFFDTSFLIYALGHAGPQRQIPAIELLWLLSDCDASLACFTHTVDEMRGVLRGCADKIRMNALDQMWGPTAEYFISNRYSVSDIELVANRIEKDLMSSIIREDNRTILSIQVIDKPDYDHKLGIDERAFEIFLQKRVTDNYRRAALQKDVDSIAAIYRFRKRKEYHEVEKCRSVFITTNTELARATQQFFASQWAPAAVSLCLTDYALTNLLWLKRPLQSPNLPIKRIIANCYAATHPEHLQDQSLWKRYLKHLHDLKARDKLSAEDYYTLRASLYAREALMDKTHGEEDAFTEGTIDEVLEMVRAKHQAEGRKEIERKVTVIEHEKNKLVAALNASTKRIEELQNDMKSIEERNQKQKLEEQASLHEQALQRAREKLASRYKAAQGAFYVIILFLAWIARPLRIVSIYQIENKYVRWILFCSALVLGTMALLKGHLIKRRLLNSLNEEPSAS